jgi:hypothetical protein
MLEFPVSDYLQVAIRFGQILGASAMHEKKLDANVLKDSLTFLYDETVRLKLSVTHQQLSQMIAEVAKTNPANVKVGENRMEIKGASLDIQRMNHYVESVYATLQAELGSMLFKAIARERNSYVDGSWLHDSSIVAAFPTAAKELERAGICYALGQPTATVFHSMRALEPVLVALAAPFGISAKFENWQNIINDIEAKVRALGQLPKSQQKVDDEKFFGEACSHLYFIKNAWRNHVAHARDSYSDDEGLKVLQHSKEFVESLCPRLKE